MVLIAPYEPNRNRWLDMPWTNRYSRRQYTLSREPSGGWERPGVVTPKLYRDILTDYLAHEEAKSREPQGSLCEPQTEGLLPRRPVHARTITHIGKEANQLEDVLTGVADQDETLNRYDDADDQYFRTHVVPALRELGVRETARRTGFSPATVHGVLAKGSKPRARSRAAYVGVAEAFMTQGSALQRELPVQG